MVGITVRTHQRWTREGDVREDQRPLIDRAAPANALCADETQAILDACHRPDHASLPPDQIVVRLLDEEALYLGSVSTFYRVLRRHGEVAHRGRAKAPRHHVRPTTYHAVAPNRLWSWDCTWLPGPVKGTYYYLVMIIDIFSRKIVGWEVFLGESADNARGVLERAVLAERVVQQPLVLHADNGSAFKAATLLEKRHDMNIEPSFSRPRVSNDNPYSEALFRTCKYVPSYPVNGFAALSAARAWVQAFVRWYNHEHRHSGIRFVRHRSNVMPATTPRSSTNVTPSTNRRGPGTPPAGAARPATGNRFIPSPSTPNVNGWSSSSRRQNLQHKWTQTRQNA